MNTKKLKQLVLDLAIHGKLVPQDPNDEPASELLKRIVETHGRASNIGRASNKKSAISSDNLDDVPFEVPEGWCWCKLSDIADIGTGSTPATTNKSYYGGSIAWITSGSTKENYINSPISFITDLALKETNCQVYPIGTLIMAMYGEGKTRGQISELSINAATNQACAAIQLFDNSLKNYVKAYLMGNYWTLREMAEGGLQPNLNLKKISSYFIPLPPLSEQRRIVAEVEKWFGIIDQLESNEADLRKSIEQTKKKVLDLAIHGKLVPQDPNDEPASELLKRIVEMHGRASNKSKGKKSAISSEEIDEVPFEVPEGWVWCRLGEISVDSADGPFGSNLKKEHYTDKQEVRIVQLSNIGELNWRDDNVKYTTFEHLKVISRSEVFPGDIIIAKMMPAGRAIICPSKERKYVLSSDAVKFSFSNLVYNKYLFYSINSSVFKEQVYDNVQGVTRVRTSLVKLREYFIPLPPLSEQRRIVAKIEEVFKELDRMLEMIG